MPVRIAIHTRVPVACYWYPSTIHVCTCSTTGIAIVHVYRYTCTCTTGLYLSMAIWPYSHRTTNGPRRPRHKTKGRVHVYVHVYTVCVRTTRGVRTRDEYVPVATGMLLILLQYVVLEHQSIFCTFTFHIPEYVHLYGLYTRVRGTYPSTLEYMVWSGSGFCSRKHNHTDTNGGI